MTIRALMLITLFSGLLSFSEVLFAEKIFVIANHHGVVEKISIDELRDLYLGRTTRLSNGEKIYPIELSNELDAKAEFHERVTERTLDQLSAHWARLMFTGRGYPIDKVSTEASVVHYVENNKRGLGYITASSIAGDDIERRVRIVAVLQ